MSSVPLAITLDFLSAWTFWINVFTLAGIYTIFTLGLQLNVGYTGIINFGQAGFMAIGAYSMVILVLKAGLGFWAALPVSLVVTMLAGLLIGLPSLRLRADYFAIATIAFSELIRYIAQNARELTGGNQGTTRLGLEAGRFNYDQEWLEVREWISARLGDIGISGADVADLPLLLATWAIVALLVVILSRLQAAPWGRVLRAIREYEDAARALGKSSLSYKLQSLAIAAGLGAISGWLLALQLVNFNQEPFEPLITFFGYAILVLGGLASFPGVVIGSVIFWTVYEGLRFLDLPLSAERVAALRLMLVGVVLIAVMTLRPQGILGRRQEMVLGD